VFIFTPKIKVQGKVKKKKCIQEVLTLEDLVGGPGVSSKWQPRQSSHLQHNISRDTGLEWQQVLFVESCASVSVVVGLSEQNPIPRYPAIKDRSRMRLLSFACNSLPKIQV